MSPPSVSLPSALAALLLITLPNHGMAQDKTNFFGSLGLYNGQGDATQHSLASLQLGVEYKGSDFRLFGEFAATRRIAKIELQRETEKLTPEQRREYPEEVKLIDEDLSYLEARDAFIEWTPQPWLVLNLGRRKVIWGQMNAFSPVDFSLPLEFENRGVGLSRANFRVPQDQLTTFLYPTDWLELQLYYFPTLQPDPLIEAFREDLDEVTCQATPGAAGDDDCPAGFSARPIEFRKLGGHEQYAARLMLTPAWGTLGFTYFRGYQSVGFEDFETLTSTLEDGTTACTDQATCYYSSSSYTDFSRMESFSFELAVPAGGRVWKFEINQMELRDSITSLTLDNMAFDPGTSDALDRRFRALFDRILNDNQGRLYFPGTRTLLGLGVDITTDYWDISLELLVLADRFSEPGRSLIKEYREIRKARGDEEDDEGLNDEFTGAIPTFNIAWHPGGNPDKSLGTAFGYFSAYAGLIGYYTVKTSDNFRWQVGLEILSRLSDAIAAGEEEEEGIYTINQEPALQAALIYDF